MHLINLVQGTCIGTSHGTCCSLGATLLQRSNNVLPRFKTAPHGLKASLMSQPHLHLSPTAIYPFDARGVAKRFRHAAIFGALDALQPGETMRFVNDHDPLPLLDQLRNRYGDRISIEYQQRDPGAIAIDFLIR
mgnify:FL=1